jgi:hypothetical protein
MRRPSNQKRNHHADYNQFFEHVNEDRIPFSRHYDLRVTSTKNERLRTIFRPDGLVVELPSIPDSLV